jgi:hypothetical protein
MDMSMLRDHVRAALIWACSMDVNMQHGQGHAAWTWTHSMDNGNTDYIVDMNMKHGQRCH